MRMASVCGVLLGLLMTSATTADEGDWLIRVGTHYADPKSDNHDLVSVDGAFGVTFNATYFMTSNWAVELLAAVPFTHDIRATSALTAATGVSGTVGETKHLPPTLSLQYHFNPADRWRAYVGAGVNYTMFFEEDTRGGLSGLELELDDSVGLSAQVGFDVDLTEKLYLNAELRYMDIDTDVKLGGADLPAGKTVEIDPWAIGINIGLRL